MDIPYIVMCAVGGLSLPLGMRLGTLTERKKVQLRRAEKMVDLDNSASDHRRLTDALAVIAEHGGVIGDANIRNGKSVPTVRPTALPELARELRWLGDRKRGNDYLLTDRHLAAYRDAATAIERVAEDRKKSRSLYKGLTDEEITLIARGAMERVFPLLREEIRAGKQDDHKCAQTARAAVEQLFSIKGASA